MAASSPTARITTSIIEFRKYRSDILPSELFSEPAWDLLLELFLAAAEGRRITARQVATRSGTTFGVMSRWLQHLSKIGYIVGDGTGDLDDLLTLSAQALEQMERIIDCGHDLYLEVGHSHISD
jgi:hypothetical protein